jgi:hypothetical protein
MDDVASFTRSVWEMYSEYVVAGFNPDQALVLARDFATELLRASIAMNQEGLK